MVEAAVPSTAMTEENFIFLASVDDWKLEM